MENFGTPKRINIAVRRSGNHWTYEWHYLDSKDMSKWYPIGTQAIRFEQDNIDLTQSLEVRLAPVRDFHNCVLSGIEVKVHGHYDKNTKVLIVNP